MKKIMTLILAITMILIVLSGCGNNSIEENKNSIPNAEETVEETKEVSYVPKYNNTIWEYIKENPMVEVKSDDEYYLTKEDLYDADGQIIHRWISELEHMGCYYILQDEIADELSTEELLDIWFNQCDEKRASLSNFWIYAFEDLILYNNIFDLMISRDDVALVVYNKYVSMDKNSFKDAHYCLYLEVILSEYSIYVELTDEQKEILYEKATMWEKWRRDEEFPYRSWYNGSVPQEPEYYSIFLLNREGKLRRTYNWKYEE